jgi:hypothetical protein
LETNTHGNSPPPEWRYIPLNSGNKPPKGCTLADAPEYWEGLPATAEHLAALVAQRRGVGLLTHRSGLVVLDCDTRYEAPDAPLSPPYTFNDMFKKRHGLSDLLRVVAEEKEQLPPTRVVRTPSGGLHLYYAQNPRLPVMSKGHRKDWLIDVKASPNTWVVAPPTPGYVVERDLPVAMLPFWLALFIKQLNRTYPAVSSVPGSSGRGTLPTPPGVDGHDAGLYDAWLHTLTEWVAEANTIAAHHPHGKGGDWGNRIFQAARIMHGVVPDDDADALLITAAAPWNDHEEDAARRHIINGRAWAHDENGATK